MVLSAGLAYDCPVPVHCFPITFTDTDESECYQRNDSQTHPGIKVKFGISQRLFPVMRSLRISKFCLKYGSCLGK